MDIAVLVSFSTEGNRTIFVALRVHRRPRRVSGRTSCVVKSLLPPGESLWVVALPASHLPGRLPASMSSAKPDYVIQGGPKSCAFYCIFQSRQSRTGSRPKLTHTDNLVKTGHVVCEICGPTDIQTDRQTDRQTDTLIAIHCSPNGRFVFRMRSAVLLDCSYFILFSLVFPFFIWGSC